MAWAVADGQLNEVADLVDQAESPRRREAMQQAIGQISSALDNLRKPTPWGPDLKVSDEFLDPLFDLYHEILGLPSSLMRKKRYYELADFIPLDQVDVEVVEKLDAIAAVAASVQPMV